MADAKRYCVVTTTINVPKLLEAYVDDAKAHARAAEFVVIGDRKTPPETATLCADLEQRTGTRVAYYSPDDQTSYLERWDEFAEFLPWNCIQRRNVGLLVAYECGADIVVTIDDDNFLAQEDYLGRHAHLGDEDEFTAVESSTGWWNVCEMLDEARGIPFYHRGHPLSKRWVDDEPTRRPLRARAVVNAGLWLDDPDVDAITRLTLPVCATGPSEQYEETLALAPGTWAPFNSQNTALARDLVPAYLLFPHIGRYDDIWASYVVRRIADEFGDVVTYGAPLVRQERNPHNYFVDFDAERFGLESNDVFLEALRSCTISARDYANAYGELAEQFPGAIESAAGAAAPAFGRVAEGFALWAAIFRDFR